MSARSWLADRLDSAAGWFDDWAARLEMAAARVDESYPSVTKAGAGALHALPAPTHATTPTKPADGPTGAPDATHDPTSGTAEG